MTQPKALQWADQLDQYLLPEPAAELRRLHAENERLNDALKWEQHREGWIGTHGPGCWKWGPQHYECTLRVNAELLAAMRKISDIALGNPYAGVPCGELARAALARAEERK